MPFSPLESHDADGRRATPWASLSLPEATYGFLEKLSITRYQPVPSFIISNNFYSDLNIVPPKLKRVNFNFFKKTMVKKVYAPAKKFPQKIFSDRLYHQKADKIPYPMI